MRYKNFASAYTINTKTQFCISRGYQLKEDPTLAYVRYDINKVTGREGIFKIIDIESGLSVLTRTTRKQLLESYEYLKDDKDFLARIKHARETKTYSEIVKACEEAKKEFKAAGYVI